MAAHPRTQTEPIMEAPETPTPQAETSPEGSSACAAAGYAATIRLLDDMERRWTDNKAKNLARMGGPTHVADGALETISMMRSVLWITYGPPPTDDEAA